MPLIYRLLMARHTGDVIGESAMHIAVATSTCVMIVNALVGTVTYMALAGFTGTDFGPWFEGFVDLLAFAVLTLGALLGIRLATPWIGRIPDRLHAWVYVGLLMVVMGGMLLG